MDVVHASALNPSPQTKRQIKERLSIGLSVARGGLLTMSELVTVTMPPVPGPAPAPNRPTGPGRARAARRPAPTTTRSTGWPRHSYLDTPAPPSAPTAPTWPRGASTAPTLGCAPFDVRRHHVNLWMIRLLTTKPLPRTGRPLAPASIARRLSLGGSTPFAQGSLVFRHARLRSQGC